MSIDSGILELLQPPAGEIISDTAHDANRIRPNTRTDSRVDGISPQRAWDYTLVRGDTIILPQTTDEEEF